MIQAGPPQKTEWSVSSRDDLGWDSCIQCVEEAKRQHQRSSGGSGKAKTQTIKVRDRHWCCCIAGHSKPPMQHEKRTLWAVQGCFFNSTCFCPLTVWAVRFLCTERQSVERTKYEIYAFMCLEVQQTCLFKMCHMCMKIHARLDLSLWFQTKTWLQDWNPRGRGSTSIQNRETRQETAKQSFPSYC